MQVSCHRRTIFAILLRILSHFRFFIPLLKGTSKLVFERVIKGPGAMLANCGVVLVTHASHFLNRVDNILLLVEGENKFLGTWEELRIFEASDAKTRGAVNHIRSAVQEAVQLTEDGEDVRQSTQQSEGDEKLVRNHLIQLEERQHGLSSFKTWLLWFHRAGGCFFLSTQILLMAIDRVAYVTVEWWLAKWTNGAYTSIKIFGFEFPAQTDGRSAQFTYLKVYSIIVLVTFISTTTRSQWSVTGGARAAKNVHATMLKSILGAPMVSL
jgi:hypothetical protein